jgi:peptidoglycan/xylan/chitin deacetylase (PgdA/CDA1 family)
VAATAPTPTPTAAPFDATVFAPMSPLAQNARVPVIMYHDIIKERRRDSVYFDTTKQEFADQIGWLEEQGASFISLEQLHRHLTRGEALPPNAVALTFDDNYQGFHDNAYPLLKEKHIPSAVFVHTNYVGDKKGTHPKMTWETLQALDKEGLVTVGSHTLSHPEDMAKLPLDEQEHELTDSKSILEQHLGHPIPYFAYPSGTGDQQTFDAAQRAGYTMAFTMHNGPAEESPSILTVNRYIDSRLKKAWEDARKAEADAPAAIVDMKLAENPVTLQVGEFEGVKLGMVRGGTPATWRTPTGRASVGEFIQQAGSSGILPQPPVAGMNGTFFADAALRGTDNAMIGPCLVRADGTFYPETDQYRLTKLLNRPLVLWGPSRFMIVPFNPQGMNDEATIKALMPDVTDLFLAGAWIVHDGQPRTKEEMGAFSAHDFNDPRRRAFFGVTESGDIVLGGTLDVVTTEAMAKAAAAAGVKEAILMDSGFSTSIVYDGKIIVTGHTAKDLPSRPVPHAIILTGTLSPPTDPETSDILAKADEAVGAIPAMEAQANAPGPSSSSGAHPSRRRHRH